jgi:hypothetical protein
VRTAVVVYTRSVRHCSTTSGRRRRLDRSESNGVAAVKAITGKRKRAAQCGAVGTNCHRIHWLKSRVVAPTSPARSDPVQRRTTTCIVVAVRTSPSRNVTLIASAGLSLARKTGANTDRAPSPAGP